MANLPPTHLPGHGHHPPSAEQRPSLTSSKALANHTDSYFIMDGYEACLSPSRIQLHLPDLDNLPLSVDLRGATMGLIAKLEPIIMKLEDKLGLKVVRIDRDTIVARISQLHIALKNHQFTETINERGEKLYVYVDNVLRVVVDRSHGLHEYEAGECPLCHSGWGKTREVE